MDPQPRRQRASVIGATKRNSVPASLSSFSVKIAQAANHRGGDYIGWPTTRSFIPNWAGAPHFQQIKKLEAQCSCTSAQDDRKACAAWWDQKTMIHHALKLPPTFWPCLPDPNGPVSPGAKALYAALDAALTGM